MVRSELTKSLWNELNKGHASHNYHSSSFCLAYSAAVDLPGHRLKQEFSFQCSWAVRLNADALAANITRVSARWGGGGLGPPHLAPQGQENSKYFP